jgi:hypothetical protein
MRVPVQSARLRGLFQLPLPYALALALPLTLAASALTGCTPDIGDSCALSTDCDSDGTRVCDTAEPGGYCTVLNCTGNELGSVCPDNALCVLFEPNVPGCPISGRVTGRTGESQCRKTCTSNSDCRADYFCRLPQSAPWNAEILDPDQTAAICLPLLVFIDGGTSPVSYGYDGSPDAVPPVCNSIGPAYDAGWPALDAAVDAGADAAPDSGKKNLDAGHKDGGKADAKSDAKSDAKGDAKVDATLDAGHGDSGKLDAAKTDAGVDASKDASHDAPDAG